MFIQTRKEKHSNIRLSPRCVKLSGCKFKIISTVNLTFRVQLKTGFEICPIILFDWLIDWLRWNVVLSGIQSLASVYKMYIHSFSCDTNSMSESSFESQAAAFCKQQQMLQPLSCTYFILAVTRFTHFCSSLVVMMVNIFTCNGLNCYSHGLICLTQLHLQANVNHICLYFIVHKVQVYELFVN